MMKDVRAQCFESDEKVLQEKLKRMAARQIQGKYPLRFELPIGLQMELTGRCNLRCKHCYNVSGETAKTTMTPEDWRTLARQLVAAGGLFECIISGGEPLLLGDDLPSIMDILHEDGTAFVLISNGFFMDDAWVRRLKKYRYSHFQISIDGAFAELHDEFRGVPGSFERATAAAFKAAAAGLPVRIAHTVSRSTLSYMEDMVELAWKLGAQTLVLGEAMPSGRTYDYVGETVLTGEDLSKMYDSIEKLIPKYGGKIEIQRSSFLKHQLLSCQSQPNSAVIVRPDGSVRLDCMTPFVIGNVKERPFLDIWREKGGDCWRHPKVKQYIDSVQGMNNWSDEVRNYADEDIWI